MRGIAVAIDEQADLSREIAALETLVELDGFDDALLEQAEAMLEGAFHAGGGAARSPSDIFAGGRPRRGTERLKRCSDEWTRRVHAAERRRAQFSRPLIDEHDFRNSRVVHIVNGLSESEICWIRHVFMPECASRVDYGRRYQRMFWRQFQATLPEGHRLDMTLLQRMAELMVFSFASWRVDYLIQTEPLWELFGVGKSNWHQRYVPHWRAMERAALLHHRRCLMAVLRDS